MKQLREYLKSVQFKYSARSINAPDHHNTTGHRIFVKAGVNEVKRYLKNKGITVKKVRVSANMAGWTEVIHTQNPGWNHPRVYVVLQEKFEVK